MKKKGFLFLLCSLFWVTCQKGVMIPAYNVNDSFDKQLKDIYQNGQLPGFAVAIVNKDGILYENTFGFSDLANKTAYTKSTKQNIASISKTFIGFALMQTIKNGQLSLETPINDILPFKVINPHYPDLPITIHHLATHTASINDHEIEYERVFLKEPISLTKKEIGKENLTFFQEWATNESLSLGTFLAQTLPTNGTYHKRIKFLKKAPGIHYKYSNLGASLLAYCIELTTKQPFSEYVQGKILMPLGMKQTNWNANADNGTEPTTTYFENQLRVPHYQNILYPAGSLYSTPHDLIHYLMQLLKMEEGTNDFLNPSLFQRMINPQLQAAQFPHSSAKNVGLMWELNGQQVGHNGANYGVTLFMAFDKKEKYGRLFMTNISSYKSQKLIPQMVEIWKLLGKEGSKLN